MNSKQKDIKAKYNELVDYLNYHSRLYYTFDSPQISDIEYDKLYTELREIEKNNPDIVSDNSPTKRVGDRLAKGFKAIKHIQPMLSLFTETNTSEEGVVNFFERLANNGVTATDEMFVAEVKFDGLAINLTYNHGLLISAATRGDGVMGEDVTNNIFTIDSIPKFIDYKKLIEVRGEIVMYKSVFKQLNEEQIRKNLKPFVNPRNAAAGSIRQHDPKVTKSRKLQFCCYGVGFCSEKHNTYKEQQYWLDSLGFPIYPVSLIKNNSELYDTYKYIESTRESIPFEIDGVVYKINDLDTQEKLGYISREPRWAMAHKFIPEEAATKLLAIDIQVGRTGKLTPVARLLPVFVGGTTVTNVTLHNESEIIRKDLRIGDMVYVRRAGDVIPEITRPVLTERQFTGFPYNLMHSTLGRCPVCSSTIAKEEEEANHYCTASLTCPAQIKNSFVHFAHKGAMDIDGLGDKVISTLVDKRIIQFIPDIYKLKVEDLNGLQLNGGGFLRGLSSAKLIEAIEASKKTTQARLIYGLGIRHVGVSTAKNLVNHFKDICILRDASVEQLMEVSDVGKIVAQSVYDFFHDNQKLSIFTQLLQNGFEFTDLTSQSDDDRFANQTFVITGSFDNFKREDIKSIVESCKGTISGSVGKSTNFLICGKDAGTKLKDALDRGIRVIYEKEFMDMVSDLIKS